MTLLVRPPRPTDETAWRALWAGYNRFYRAEVPPDVTEALWQKLLSAAADVSGLVAERGGEIIGFTNYLFHASTWSHSPSCYLEDLFVAPAGRGTGAGQALIEAVATAAKARGAERLYWHTQEYNSAARSLYDSLATRTSFVVYRKPLD